MIDMYNSTLSVEEKRDALRIAQGLLPYAFSEVYKQQHMNMQGSSKQFFNMATDLAIKQAVSFMEQKRDYERYFEIEEIK